MCGRFTLFSTFETIMERFHIESAFDEMDYQISYNIAPSQRIVAVINDGSKNRLGYLRWGLIPSWAKDEKIGYKLINARSETLAEKPSFRKAYQNKRCLIVADSYYEWKQTPERKIPMLIKMKSGEPFGMAGLWEGWKSPEGQTIYTCTIITTSSNELTSSIHERMPVILNKKDEQKWLDPSIHDSHLLNQYLRPFSSELMETFEVSTEANSPKNNSERLIQRIC